MDHTFCLPSSQVIGLEKHFLENKGAVQPLHLPTQALIQEHLNIHMPLHFSNRQTLPTHPLLGGEGFIPLIPIPQLQQTVVTKETTKILCYLGLMMQSVKNDSKELLAIQKTGLPMRYNFTHFVLYNSLQKHTIPW